MVSMSCRYFTSIANCTPEESHRHSQRWRLRWRNNVVSTGKEEGGEDGLEFWILDKRGSGFKKFVEFLGLCWFCFFGQFFCKADHFFDKVFLEEKDDFVFVLNEFHFYIFLIGNFMFCCQNITWTMESLGTNRSGFSFWWFILYWRVWWGKKREEFVCFVEIEQFPRLNLGMGDVEVWTVSIIIWILNLNKMDCIGFEFVVGLILWVFIWIVE